MIRTFSLQAKQAQLQDRSFYAFGEHKPPPRYQSIGKKSQNIKTERQLFGSGDQTKLASEYGQQQPQQQKIGHGLALVGQQARMGAKKAPRVVGKTKQQQQNLNRHNRKVTLQSSASPMLSDHKNKIDNSNFGTSTQMIVEDGTASNAMIQQEMGTPKAQDLNQKSYNNRIANSGMLNYGSTSFVNHNDNRQRFNSFNRQKTLDYDKEDKKLLQLEAVAEDVAGGQNGNEFRSRAQRGSIVSDTLQYIQDKEKEPVVNNQVNSAEQLSKLQNHKQMFDHMPDEGTLQDNHHHLQDQVSEMRRMEIQMENLRVAKQMNNSAVLTSYGENMLSTNLMVSQGDPQSPPLNVILPTNVQTGFNRAPPTLGIQNSKEAEAARFRTSDPCNNSGDINKKKRAQTAQTRGKASQKLDQQHNQGSRRGKRRLRQKSGNETAANIEAQNFNTNLVVMNDKQMHISSDATAKGIVSLYNKGFVPKKTGMVSKKSKFASSIGQAKTLYDTVADPQPASVVNEQSLLASDTLEFSQQQNQQDFQNNGNSYQDHQRQEEGGVGQLIHLAMQQTYHPNVKQPKNDRIEEEQKLIGLKSSFSNRLNIDDNAAENQRFKQQPANSRMFQVDGGSLATENGWQNIGGRPYQEATLGLSSVNNVRVSNSQLYQREKEYSEENLTAINTVDKNSFQASEVVLQSVGAFTGDGIIDYGAKEQESCTQDKLAIGQISAAIFTHHHNSNILGDQAQPSNVTKSQFKLPRNQEVVQKDGPGLTPQNLVTKSIISAGFGTNEDRESREMTEVDENVMGPINMHDKIGSVDSQKTSGQLDQYMQQQHQQLLLISKDGNNNVNKNFTTTTPKRLDSQLDDSKMKSTVHRVQSAGRKSLRSKQSASFIRTEKSAAGRSLDKSRERSVENTGRPASGAIQKRMNRNRTANQLKTGSSKKEAELNEDLLVRRSFENKKQKELQRLTNNYSQFHNENDKNLKKNHSSFMLTKARSPAGTSLSLFPGYSLQSRPLIGSQLVKNLAIQNIPKQSQQAMSDTERRAFSQSQQSRAIHPNNQIRLEISAADLLHKGAVIQNSIGKAETFPLQNLEKAFLLEHAPQEVRTPQNNAQTSFAILAIEENQQINTVGPQIEQAARSTSQERLGQRQKSDNVLVSDVGLHQAQTLEQLASNSKVFSSNEFNNIKNDDRHPSHQIMSGISSRTQQIDAMGKIRHVFLINHSQEQMQVKSSRDKRSSQIKNKRRRKKRPSSSRLNKRNRGFHFDLINEKASNGEEIATVQGGSTSRNNQHSHREIGNRRGSEHGILEMNPLSLPNIRKDAQEFITDTNRSMAFNVMSSSHENENLIVEKDGGVSLKPNSIHHQNNSSYPLNLMSDNDIREKNKHQTLPVESLRDYIQNQKGIGGSLVDGQTHLQQQQTQDRYSVHNSINDYLKNEEISKVQILDVPKSGFKTLNSDNGLNYYQEPIKDHSQVTVYKTNNQAEYATLAQGGTSGPPTASYIPINAMYSHMSIQRGTGSIETNSKDELITDPKLGIQTPKAQMDGTSFLPSAKQEQAIEEANLQNVVYIQSPSQNQNDNQMKVVTKIRSRVSKGENFSYDDSKEHANQASDFNGQADLKIFQGTQHDGGNVDSQGEELQTKEQQEFLGPQFLSSHHLHESQLSAQQNTGQGHLSSQYTPELLPMPYNEGYQVSLIQDSAHHPAPSQIHQQHHQHQIDDFYQSDPTNQLALQQQHQQIQQYQAAQYWETLFLSHQQQFGLGSTIKKNQNIVKKVQIQANAPHNTHQMKQDDLLAKKDQSVIPMSVATVPEKTQYQKRLYANQGDPGLSIVGQQTHSITKQQFNNHIRDTNEFYKSLTNQMNQNQQTQLQQQQQDYQPEAVLSNRQQIGPVMMRQLTNMSNNNTAQLRDNKSESPPRFIDKGLQNTYREDLTSNNSGGSQNNAYFGGLDQSRRTVQTAGFTNNETFDAGIKSPQGQHPQNFQEIQDMQSTERPKAVASSLAVIEQTAHAPNQFSTINKQLDNHMAHRPYDRPTSQDFAQLKVIPVNQHQNLHPNQHVQQRNHLGNVMTSNNMAAGELRSPIRTTEDGTEFSMSPYAILKNRLMLSSTQQAASSQQSQYHQANQADFSNRVSERMLFQSEQSNPKTNSTTQIPNQDLAELADLGRTTTQKGPHDIMLGGLQLVPTTTSPFVMQGAENAKKQPGVVDPTTAFVEAGSLVPTTEEPKIQTTVGIQSLPDRDETNQTVLLQQPTNGHSQMLINQDDLHYSSGSNISELHNNQNSLDQLQATIPAKLDVKIVKVGNQAQTAQQSKRHDYQGAPPNYFMRKGSANSSLQVNTPQLNMEQASGGSPLAYYYDKKQEPTHVGPEINKRLFKNYQNGPNQLSLAVETRNNITGTRRKIVNSVVQSTDIDRTSDQTQTEAAFATDKFNRLQEQGTLTLDYNNDYSSAYKQQSDHSYRILNPRLVNATAFGEDSSKHNSIQVTIGRVNSSNKKGKDNLDLQSISPSKMRISCFSIAQNKEDELKVEKSKSKVYESLSGSLYQVGQKSLQQLGVSSQITYQQSFNNIRDSVKRQNELKGGQTENAQTREEQQYAARPPQGSEDQSKNGKDNTNKRRRKRHQSGKIPRAPTGSSLKYNQSQLLPPNHLYGNGDAILEAILEDPLKPFSKKSQPLQRPGLESASLTRDGLRASQNIIEFSANNQQSGLLSSSSGIFDPQSDVLKFTSMRNNKAMAREDPNYSRKSTIQNLIAKRQKTLYQPSNVPIPPMLNSLNSSSVTEFGHGQQECFSQKLAMMNRPFTSGGVRSANYARQGSGAELAFQSQPQQVTISAMSDFEKQIERADKQQLQQRQQQNKIRKGSVVRPNSYSTQQNTNYNAKTALNHHQKRSLPYTQAARASRAARPISSGNQIQMTSRGPQSGFVPGTVEATTVATNYRSRPLTASENRRAILSAKNRPSLVKACSSSNYASGGHQPRAADEASNTQASSAMGGAILIASSNYHDSKQPQILVQENYQKQYSTKQQQQYLQQHQQHKIIDSSRNQNYEYSTTYQYGGNSIGQEQRQN